MPVGGDAEELEKFSDSCLGPQRVSGGIRWACSEEQKAVNVSHRFHFDTGGNDGERGRGVGSR